MRWSDDMNGCHEYGWGDGWMGGRSREEEGEGSGELWLSLLSVFSCLPVFPSSSLVLLSRAALLLFHSNTR